MDWDDDQEATHIFDKDTKDSRDKEKVAEPSSAALAGPEAKPADRADFDAVMSAPPRTSQIPAPPGATASAPPPPPPAAGMPAVPASTSSGSAPPAPASLSGAFASLGTNGASTLKSAPPPSQSMRSAPPPPPGSMRPHNPSTSTAPMPPPPPPGQTTTAPMHMPPRPSAPPAPAAVPSAPPAAAMPSAPPVASQPPAAAVLPPVQRAMEATAVVPRAQSRTPMWIAALVAVMAIAGVGVFMTMQQHGPGTLVINATDATGKAVSGLEILVDDAKKCDSSPCIVRDVAPGPHVVKVTAPGYEAAPKAIGVEAQKSATVDIPLVGGKATVGTGVKVSGTQPGVKLFVDGKEIGTLPQEVKDLEAGDHKIRVAGSDRYAPMEKTVTVGKNEMVDLGNVALKVLKGKVMFQLGTPGAKVYLVASPTNRKEIPQFPIAIDFEPTDKYELVATAPGFEELRRPITFDDGIAEKSFTIELTPKGQAAAPSTAAQAVHTTSSAPAAEKPASGSKAPAFLANESGGEKPAATPAATPKKDAPAAAGGEAFLNINSIPPSTVVLDGKPLGPTPKMKVGVSAGAHTILFVNAEQSLKKSITVNVGAGETKPAFAKLKE